MHRFPKAVLGLILLASTGTAAQACSYKQQLSLLTGALYREAIPRGNAQAAVATIIFNRLESGRYGSNLCRIITAPAQFVYRLPARPNPRRLALARQNAATFLEEFKTWGRIHTHGQVYQRLAGYDSFHARYVRPNRKGGVNIGDNIFYRARRR